MHVGGIKYLLLFVFWPILLSAQENYSCVKTSRDTPGPFYVRRTPKNVDLAPEQEMADDSQRVILGGRLLDQNCDPIRNARVEIWYAGGDNVRYTFRPDYLWYRGEQNTDEDGSYEFNATFPGVYGGRPIPHYHYKVTAKGREFVTQLYFQDKVPRSYEDYVSGRPTQFPKSVEFLPNRNGVRKITFDIVMES